MKISVIGLGIIGKVWACHLRDDGHEVWCWNRTPKPDFPGFVPDIGEAVDGAEAVFIVVADPAAVGEVIDPILPGLGAGAMVIQSSTISAAWTIEFAARVAAVGGRFIEAPFTGSKPAAEARETVFYLGGEAEDVERARPVLGPLSRAIQHIGPLGTASTLKLAMNLNLANMAQALCESLLLARAVGISDDTYFEALSRNVGRSGLSDLKEPKLRAHDYAPQFSLKHMGKDLRLALETAASMGLACSQTETLRRTYEAGAQAGWGDDDFIGLMRSVEQSSNEG